MSVTTQSQRPLNTIPIPLIGMVSSTLVSRDESMDSELAIHRVPARQTWSGSGAVSQADIDRTVSALRRVYADAAPLHRAWSAEMLAAAAAVGTCPPPQFRSAIAERERIAGPVCREMIRRIGAICAAHGLSRVQTNSSIEQSALGGDETFGSRIGDGILAADPDGSDVGFRASIFTALLRLRL